MLGQGLKNDFFCYKIDDCETLASVTKQTAVDQFGKKNFKIKDLAKRRPNICIPAWKVLTDANGVDTGLVEI